MVIYLAGPDCSSQQLQEAARRQRCEFAVPIQRRGCKLGYLGYRPDDATPSLESLQQAWQNAQAIFLPGFFHQQLQAHQADIKNSLALMEGILADEDINELLDAPEYQHRLSPQFELMQGSFDESDPQEIIKIDADACRGDELLAEDLWLKFSWLSFDEDDASLRCRVSFGIEGHENVAADWQRQQLAADLTEALFPESAIVSRNTDLQAFLHQVLQINRPAFVERIIYFNASNGGAQFHHDVERGHKGVVFAQLYGRTAWLALPKQRLIEEVMEFITTDEGQKAVQQLCLPDEQVQTLLQQCESRQTLNDYMESHDNDPLEALLNRSPAFFQRLVERGFAFILQPGDAILLPQESLSHCAWHSVFCADQFAGHALSFAIREQP